MIVKGRIPAKMDSGLLGGESKSHYSKIPTTSNVTIIVLKMYSKRKCPQYPSTCHSFTHYSGLDGVFYQEQDLWSVASRHRSVQEGNDFWLYVVCGLWEGRSESSLFEIRKMEISGMWYGGKV